MRMYDLILKKRSGEALSKEEIDFIIQGYTKGEIPDYQMSALTMAIYFKGMNVDETTNLTMSMVNSGDVLDLSKVNGITCDKHSTGGVGDKTSITLIPLVAACGGKIAKMSGRALGHTGGTTDKLSSFKGFRLDLTNEEFINQVNDIGLSIIAQTRNLAPADKKLYALRDVTATVDNVSLIASSIMSKKIASGADAIVLDVKTGSGAFMKDEDDARTLAELMVKIGRGVGRRTIAVISDMDQPLGYAVGNALEVKEAIDTLRGEGPEDYTSLIYELGAKMLILSRICKKDAEAKEKIKWAIESGEGLKRLEMFVKAQGGTGEEVYNTELLPKARIVKEVISQREGYVEHINCAEVGMCSLNLGGGRETKDSEIDLSVGLVLKKKVGDYVKKGDAIALIHSNDENNIPSVEERLLKAYTFGDNYIKRNIIRDVIV